MRFVKTFLKLAVSIGLLGYLIYISDPKKIFDVLSNIVRSNGLVYLLVAFLLALLSLFLMALRWKHILKYYDQNVAVLRLFNFYLIGLFFNNFLPTSIGGDVIRIYHLIDDTKERTSAFASVIIERILGIAATLFLAIISLFYVSHYFEDQRILFTSIILFTLIFGFFFLFTRERPVDFLLTVFDKITLLNIGEKINKLIEAIHFLKQKRIIFVWLFTYSLLAQTCIVFMNYAIIKALNLNVAVSYLFLVIPVTFMLTMLPSINGLGVREGGFVVLLGKVGIYNAAALSVSFLNVIIPMIISLSGALLFLLHKRKLITSEVSVSEKDF